MFRVLSECMNQGQSTDLIKLGELCNFLALQFYIRPMFNNKIDLNRFFFLVISFIYRFNLRENAIKKTNNQQ